jgi:hypothetical protein
MNHIAPSGPGTMFAAVRPLGSVVSTAVIVGASVADPAVTMPWLLAVIVEAAYPPSYRSVTVSFGPLSCVRLSAVWPLASVLVSVIG